MHKRAYYGKLLLHAVRIGAYGLGKVLCYFKHIGVFCYALLALHLGHAVYVRNKVKVLYARKELVHIRIIRNVRHFALAGNRLRLYGFAVYEYIPRVKAQYSRHGFERGGFARAVMAYKAIYFARGNVQRQIVHRLMTSVYFGQIFYAQHFYPPCLAFIYSLILRYYTPPAYLTSISIVMILTIVHK